MRNGVSEKELAAKAAGERVTLVQVHDAIITEHYFSAHDGAKGGEHPTGVGYGHVPESLGLLTICVLTLWNGFTILGKSACADPDNFDQDIGRRLAKQDAVNQIWPLMGYELRSRLARDERLIGGAPVTPFAGSTVYIGTKAVAAQPMTRGDYNRLRGWTVPENENGFDEGYLVEYLDSPESNFPGYQGYVSWSPSDIFERAYRPVRQAKRSVAATAEVPGTASKEETWLDRLIIEKKELDDWIGGLVAFIRSGQINVLPKLDRDNLREQLEHMEKYSSVLRRRLDREPLRVQQAARAQVKASRT